MSKVKDASLAASGELKIDWARDHMPVLRKIQARFEKELPFRGITVAMCMHLEMKTAVLGQVLQAGGATVAITGSNPMRTRRHRRETEFITP
jgi:adenosylhomocysteinase